MKTFACGSVVPGCTQTFRASTEDDLLAQVAGHAREVHGMDEVPPEILRQVRERIRDVP